LLDHVGREVPVQASDAHSLGNKLTLEQPVRRQLAANVDSQRVILNHLAVLDLWADSITDDLRAPWNAFEAGLPIITALALAPGDSPHLAEQGKNLAVLHWLARHWD
jgi:hypothetical protein